MSDYELQFQADLEKAQALSLESLALEQFRRQKISSSDTVRDRQCDVALPPPPPPRRNSRPRSLVTEEAVTPTAGDPDLISFSSPTSKAPDPHASLKDFINQLGQQTEELTVSKGEPSTPSTMSNPYYNPRTGQPYYQYNYTYTNPSYPAPYPVPTASMPTPMPPTAVPATPVPTPYPYYPIRPPDYTNQPIYPPVRYNQTRMTSPQYPLYPPLPQPVQYNYNTTNLISRPTRPLYPQLNQRHSYPTPPSVPYPTIPSQNQQGDRNTEGVPKQEPSRKLSEISNNSNESSDTLGNLPNLIDFGGHNGNQGSVRVSVLEAFDPLLTDQNNAVFEPISESPSSVYEEYDPLDFLYGETEIRDTPYSATKKESVLPAPPPKSIPTMPAVAKRNTTNKLYDCIVKIRTRQFDNEHEAFLKMVRDVRNKFISLDPKTNPGHVIASRSGGKYPPNVSIKILVHHEYSQEPITFTSDVESTVEHVILTVVCSLNEDIREDMSGYMLRVWGANEYLTAGSSLSEYDYVRECVRLEKDIRLCLHEGRDTSLARSERDDARDASVSLDDLVPIQGAAPLLSFDNLSILLETLEGELSRAVGVAGAEGSCPSKSVVQAIKAICKLAGGIETLHVTHTLNAFTLACSSKGSGTVTPEIISDAGQYSSVAVRAGTARASVAQHCGRVRDAVRTLVALYTRMRLVDFKLADPLYFTPSNTDKAVEAHTIRETTLFCVEAVHSLPPGWSHDDYLFYVQVYHGTRQLKRMHATQPKIIDNGGFYPRIIFDTWLNLDDMPINTLPREARLVLTLYGRTQRTVENPPPQDTNQNEEEETVPGDVMYDQQELGWTALQLFDYDGMLASGNYILPIWPICTDKRIGPAPHPLNTPPQPHPLINIEIPLYAHTGVKWSSGSEEHSKYSAEDLPKFDSLDGHTRTQLLYLIEQGAYQRMPTECREIIWEKRQYLVDLPGALPLVLMAASNWYGENRAQLMKLLHVWNQPSPLNAMHLLLPCFPEMEVRSVAVSVISAMSDDDLCRALPQLTQALRHEPYAKSPLAELLLTRSLAAPSVAHRLFWLLVHELPAVPQSSNEEFLGISLEENVPNEEPDSCMASRWRFRLMLRALLAITGEKLSGALLRQHKLVKTLSDVAGAVKGAREGARARALAAGAERLGAEVRGGGRSLPLGLASAVADVDVKSCSYFNSNTLPLKINFIGCDNAIIPAMFKVGDDLRQDALVLQVMRVMDSLWLKGGLDLRMVTFEALPTNDRGGMIEIVSEAETLRAIQTEWGLTGSFKDKPIAEWLAKHNPSELEYQRARDNFTASCAGYSVATYLLGICDRHNDNIMLKTSGHLFHIDFGKFLGDAQMFGNFKRDRAPFVLTHDMVYVINGGERPTQRFHHFVELCCMAFNIVRAHSNHILDLFALMASSGVPGVTHAAVTYVRAALLPASTNAEAAAAFARLIHSSLKSKFTPINFFLHNLAQLRASGDQSTATSELLSFMPRTYTMAQEGRLVSVEVMGFEKRYDPEKHYVYALRIYRAGQATPSVLYRSYKHFTELYQKICLHYPLAKVHCLPSGLHVGRSNVRQVAERRYPDVQKFLASLFSLADEIAHSDLVYTFFHPLLRDQQDVEPQRMKNPSEAQDAENTGSGSLKLSVQYAGGALTVLILHAQSLALTPQGIPPSPYVKVYLLPDATKETKRKTRVLRRNSHPSFMEMLEYRLPLDVITSRSLQATVWHYDSLQENTFLGGVVIPLASLPLREETVAWYPLEYITR